MARMEHISYYIDENGVSHNKETPNWIFHCAYDEPETLYPNSKKDNFWARVNGDKYALKYLEAKHQEFIKTGRIIHRELSYAIESALKDLKEKLKTELKL